MVLEIKRLLAKGEYRGGIAYEFVAGEDDLLIPLCSFDGAVSVEGAYEILEDGDVVVNLTLTYRLKGQCSYCLKDAERVVVYSTEALFVTDKDDLDNYYYDGVRLDLSKAVTDALLISQPDVLLCGACGGDDKTR